MSAMEQVEVGKYQPYPEYKDSGVEWLGLIPKHWALRRAKFIFQRIQRPVRDIDGIVTAFRDGQVTLRSNRRIDGFTNALQEIGYQGVRKGDLLIHAMDGFAGAIGISDSDGKCSPVCSVCTPISKTLAYPAYYGYLIRQLAVTGFITSLSKGIRERSTEFRFSEFSPLGLALPPHSEQRTIAAFLDYETARIDKLIAQQQRLIELLKEKRQAVISHAVTKGLNPDAPMKDSGVEWLGEVPEHWGVKRFNHVINYLEGPGILAKDFHDDGTPLLRIQNVKGDFVSSDYKTFLDPELADTKWNHFKVKSGDLIISCSASTGLVAEVNGDTEGAIPYTGLIRLRCGTKLIDKNFIKLLVQSDMFFKQIERLQTGSTIQHYGPAHLQQMYVYLPSLPEQKSIVSTITQNLAKCEFLTKKAEDAITLMQERRTALISAAVTGKIDLRGWTAPTEEVAA